jgi:hypothetical protein
VSNWAKYAQGWEPMMLNLGQSKGIRCGKIALFVLLFALVAVTSASANSVSYTFSANFGTQQIQGILTWNTATSWVPAYSYSLSGAGGTATCSSLLACGWLAGSFGNQLVGMLTPFSMGGSNYIYLTTSSGVRRTTVSVPEEGFVADLAIILLALPWAMRHGRLA